MEIKQTEQKALILFYGPSLTSRNKTLKKQEFLPTWYDTDDKDREFNADIVDGSYSDPKPKQSGVRHGDASDCPQAEESAWPQ